MVVFVSDFGSRFSISQLGRGFHSASTICFDDFFLFISCPWTGSIRFSSVHPVLFLSPHCCLVGGFELETLALYCQFIVRILALIHLFPTCFSCVSCFCMLRTHLSLLALRGLCHASDELKLGKTEENPPKLSLTARNPNPGHFEIVKSSGRIIVSSLALLAKIASWQLAVVVASTRRS